MRKMLTVSVAVMLALSVGVLGIWLLLSGEQGTGMLEHHQMMHDGDHYANMDIENHDGKLGAPSDRGIIGGYRGGLGFIMLLVFIVLTSLLLYTFFSDSPVPPQQTTCWNCQRPVETDWETCPFCGSNLPDDQKDATPGQLSQHIHRS